MQLEIADELVFSNKYKDDLERLCNEKHNVKRSIFSLLSMNFTRFQSKVMISNGVLYL